MITQLSVSQLTPHPANRPMGINQDKVQQLAEIMRHAGYDHSKPIKARKNGSPDTYQIIEGEHRWRAAQEAGITQVPVFIVELDDQEALIELVRGNAQTESHALEYGYIALEVCSEHSKKGMSYLEFAKKVGLSQNTLLRATKGAKIRKHIEQYASGGVLLSETFKLDEIYKCQQSDWVWFHNLVVEKELSKSDCKGISKRIREIDDIAGTYAGQVFDLTALKQSLALEKEAKYKAQVEVLQGIESCATQLSGQVTLYRYSVNDDAIIEEVIDPAQELVNTLKELKQIDRVAIFNQFNRINDKIRQQTKEQAEKDREYYKDEQNKVAAELRAQAEWEAFTPVPGTWYQLGRHWLYCGDNRDQAFLDKLPKAAFAFADPPYNAGVDEWDHGFKWEQDYLQDYADIVAVTPGISSIDSFFKATTMQYKWSLTTWIKNGMTRGALGFGNWIYTAIFSMAESIHRNAQDFNHITIKTSDSETHYHAGHKPNEYMRYMIDLFTKHGDSVIDNFLGSGTTLIECEKTGRTCYGAEKDPVYCKEIMRQFKAL